MSGETIGLLSVAALLLLIYFGLHIGVSLLMTSLCAVAALRGPDVALRMTGAVANDSLREYLFAVVPLFILMGLLVTVSGVGRDTFDLFERLLRRVRGGLGVATVFANAVFASITGISIASASVFSKVAVPEMIRHGYTQRFSVGVVAGSSVLGMLIPPSLLMIVYGVLAEESVGRMFIAGILPGILVASCFIVLIVGMTYLRPHLVLEHPDRPMAVGPDDGGTLGEVLRKGMPIVSLIVLVLGGLYAGFFNPTEAGAVGALGALVIALLRRTLTPGRFWQILVETGHVAVSVLFLVLAASMFSRMLAMSGLPSAMSGVFLDGALGPYVFLFGYLALILMLGCLIDSVSIMLIVLPIALPVARAAGFDIVWFGVLTVVAVEIGLLTPPFGISVYTVKSALNDHTLSIRTIFAGATPFVLAMLFALGILVAFPGISTYLTAP
ncbi:TRAP transporter large permease [Azospirillum sp. RWY-5-1]|uniref:TRAP transporter large permease protein n=1 Tax=Azospirillum oleiclasticum TaxID=2735135 RepID=A0ABX2T9W5_9PROT|nr:TRAP transporter large permease [Azospirillum oleiclasticum]NYZ13803.1 TRAP transporter large permease [Azospirillum oleiclasticum]NYZ21075.1 TRAP transporter large permease [Azospirillum oleiclasticum]